MDFILKKFVSFFLEPYSFIVVLLFLGFLFLIFESYRKAKLFIFLSLFSAFLFSSSIFSNFLLSPLENKYEKIKSEKIKGINYVLLLGGDFEARAYEAIRLYTQNPNLKIITSGYKGNYKISQALYSKNELIKLGIKEENILIQEEPRDTIEEAINIKKFVEDERFILVTSASHMPRAMMIFEKFGHNPIPAPTAHRVEDLESNNYIELKELQKTNMALHEHIGIAWLYLKEFLNK